MKIFHAFFLFGLLGLAMDAAAKPLQNQDSIQIMNYYQKGFDYYRSGLLDSGIFYLNKSDYLAVQSQDDFRHFKALLGIAICRVSKGEYTIADSLYLNVLQNTGENKEKSQELVALAYQGLGLVQYYLQNFDESIKNYTKTKEIREQYFGKEHIETAKIYANIGLVFELLSMYDSSIFYQKKALEIFSSSLGAEHLYVGRMYFNMATSYNARGESLQAVLLMESAINIRQKNHGTYHYQVARGYERLGEIYIGQSLYSKANKSFLESLSIREQLDIKEETRDLGNLYQQLALNSAYNKDNRTALEYAEKSQNILAKSLGKDNPEYLISEMIYGDIYFENKDFASAVKHYENYISEYERRGLSYQKSLSEAYYDKGVSFSFLEDYQASNTSLIGCLETLEISTQNDFPNFTNPVLALKARHIISSNYVKMHELDKALESIELSQKLLERTRGLFVNREDIESLNKIWHDNNQLGVQVCHSLFKKNGERDFLNQIFGYINKNKGSLINAKLNDALSKKAFGLPDSVRLKEQSLISLFASKKNELSSLSGDLFSSQLKEVNSLQFELEEIQDYYKTNHTSYYQSKFENEYVSLDEYQESLMNDELSLHIHFGDSVYYLMAVSHDNLQTYLSANHEILLLADSMRKLLMNRESVIGPVSSRLYDLLFDPIDSLSKSYSTLKIFSDGKLNYIPLEILEDRKGNYLFTSHDISYAISPELLKRPKSNGPNKNLSELLSFAPDFASDKMIASSDIVRGELSKLPGAFEEVNVLKDIFTGLTFLREEASETNFVKNAQEYDIIHLATHAIVNDEKPELSRLVFDLSADTINDGYLHAYEIYNLDLNAQLVTLSACNTGFGKIQKGEGVMSLSRAFAYAGVPATVVSLWPASDKSTPELMTYFYQNLKDGQAKDVALNNARKQYLSTAKGKARHPFYWGGFVLIGDNKPLKSTSNNMLWVFLIVVVIGVAGIAAVRKNGARG